MRFAGLVLTAAAMLAAAAVPPITDKEIRRRIATLERGASKEPALMALDTLLQTAVLVQPYLSSESQRLYGRAVRHAQSHADIAPSYAVVRLWMALDPDGGEARLRILNKRRRVLDALISYYTWKGLPERAASLAAEAIRTDRQDSISESDTLRAVGTAKPAEAVELFESLTQDPRSQRTLADSAEGLFEGLLKASETQPETVRRAAERLKLIVQSEDFAAKSEIVITTEFEYAGRKIATSDTRSTMLEYLALLDHLLEPATHDAARKTIAARRTDLRMDRPQYPRRPPVLPDLSLEHAVARIKELEPAKFRLGELWRYLVGKPRTDEEARTIVATLISWADRATPDSDPFWFVQSLLNLDGRLGPPGKQWVLPPALRPTVFQAAARIGQKMDRDPETLARLIDAMRAEGIPVPADSTSAQARAQVADLRAALEARYDFTLPTLDGRLRRLQAERGKVVVLNFWATWCGPCRQEMPEFTRVYESLHNSGMELFAITDDPPEKVSGYMSRNPLPFPVLLDTGRKVFDHYRVVGLPQTFVIDGSGRITHHFNQVTEATLRKAISGEAKISRAR